MMNKTKQILLFFALSLVILSCKKVQDSDAPSSTLLINNGPTSSGANNQDIKKIGATMLSFTFSSSILANYPNEIIGTYINNIFTNTKAYKIYRTDVIPEAQIALTSINFIDRTLYHINTLAPIRAGHYRLELYDPKTNQLLLKKAFVVYKDDSAAETDEPGNYSEFIPTVVNYPNGITVSVIEAEIGWPSFYVVKVSYDPTKITLGNLSTDLSALTNHSITPAFTTSTPLREVVLTGYDPASNLDYDTYPVRTIYDETLDGVKVKSLEAIVFLNDTPEKDQVYSVNVKLNPGAQSYQSGDFQFRFAFNPTGISSYSSPLVQEICFVSKLSGRIKCVGDNTYLNSGYDTGRLTSSNPYQLSFLSNVKNIASVGFNKYGTCVVANYDATFSNSSIKCWGSNAYGLQARNSSRISDIGGNDFYQSPGVASTNSLFIEGKDADEALAPNGENSLKLANLTGSLASMCGVSFLKRVFCWGETLSNRPNDIDGPAALLYTSASPNIPLIKGYSVAQPVKLTINSNDYRYFNKFVQGNNPQYCLTLTNADNSESLYCNDIPTNAGSTVERYKTDPATKETVKKISVGQNFYCILLNRNGQPFNDNVVCEAFDGTTVPGTSIPGANFTLGANSSKTVSVKYRFLSGTPNSTTPVNTADAARDIFVITGVSATPGVCYISTTDKIKCTGARGVDFNDDLFLNSGPAYELNNLSFIDFGTKIKVVEGSGGRNLACMTISTTVHGKDYYAVKCIGNYTLSKFNYYMPSQSLWKRFKYLPVIRW